MSIRAPDRKENILQAGLDAEALYVHTLKILKNEKHFPKRSRWLAAYDILKLAKEISLCTGMANEINVHTPEDAKQRRKYQMEAYIRCSPLLKIIETVWDAEIYPLSGLSVEYYTGLVKAVKESLRKWMDSDFERYKSIK